MEALAGILALIGLVALIKAAIGWHEEHTIDQPLEQDLAAPYREGLHAAVRLQVVAQDLERQMYVEAARHMDAEQPAENTGRR